MSSQAPGTAPIPIDDAIETLYANTRLDVYYYVVYLRVPPAQAQEITQEAFLRLLRRMREGEAIENPRAWVFSTAHNLALNCKTRDLARYTRGIELDRFAQTNQSDPERSVLERERFRRIAKAVESLSHQQRMCLHLRSEGMRYRDIAEGAGISASTVGEFLRRAVNRIRKALDE